MNDCLPNSIALLLLLPFAGPLCAADTPPPGSPAAAESIQDNSFLMEEAYNQDAGVVQHINTFQRDHASGDWLYTFTQEWPAPTIKHQLSFTIPWQRLGGERGAGDLLLNYRYQFLGDGDAKVAIAPRFSLIVPTGNEQRGLGGGGWGVQTNTALSLVATPHFNLHSNLGATWTPRARDAAGERAPTLSWNAGQSLIWLPHRRFNLLCEAVYARTETVSGPGQRERSASFFISPGLRWSHNFSNGLQIVPGIAAPIGVGPSGGQHALFFYLSFEHPFRKLTP